MRQNHLAFRNYLSHTLALLSGLGLAAAEPQLQANVIYEEAVSGDLSDSGLSPTPLFLSLGPNDVLGSLDNAGAAVDRDYFSFTVPNGLVLTAIAVLPGTATGGSVSFFGLQAGSQVTVAPNAPDATGLLGWIHYGSANGNILPDLSTPAFGSSGFAVPLSAGTYSVWVQETKDGTFPYAFGFDLAPQPASVPEGGPGLLGVVALVGLLAGGKKLQSN